VTAWYAGQEVPSRPAYEALMSTGLLETSREVKQINTLKKVRQVGY